MIFVGIIYYNTTIEEIIAKKIAGKSLRGKIQTPLKKNLAYRRAAN
jgi:hypothetical protein